MKAERYILNNKRYVYVYKNWERLYPSSKLGKGL